MYFDDDDPIRQRLATRFDSYVDISIGDGWLLLVDELDNRLMALTADCGGYHLLQVKEKFGGLRYYAEFPRGVLYECQELVREAEKASRLICERCGGLVVETAIENRTICDACHIHKV